MRRRAALLAPLALAVSVAPVTAQAPTPTTPARCITLEDFAKATVGEFPTDWKPRKDAGTGVYKVLEEKGLRFLHAASSGLGVQAAKQVEWDLGAYPILAWSWQPRELPPGPDERDSETPKPAGIAVLTDSDDTKSSAQGDYANFRACRG